MKKSLFFIASLLILNFSMFGAIRKEQIGDSRKAYRDAVNAYDIQEYGKALNYAEDALLFRKQQIEYQTEKLNKSLTSHAVSSVGDKLTDVLNILTERKEYETINIITWMTMSVLRTSSAMESAVFLRDFTSTVLTTLISDAECLLTVLLAESRNDLRTWALRFMTSLCATSCARVLPSAEVTDPLVVLILATISSSCEVTESSSARSAAGSSLGSSPSWTLELLSRRVSSW